MNNMIYYIVIYFFFLSIGVFFASLVYKALFGINKVVKRFLIFSAITFLLTLISLPEVATIRRPPHYNCNGKFEQEALKIASAISEYFSVPDRTQIPKYSDLDFSGEYSTLLENRDLKRRDKLIKESEFSVKILGDAFGEIAIVLSCKKGKCPFYRWKCPRPFKGKFYVKRIGGSGANEWLNIYENI